ncbi:MAG: hypothetical protein FWF70_05455 [Bacteroidetes bacterium]|nr:hypothetical protein [Bacteroidota bacterium]MCL1968504.1 hypothetical protein [Bacteroidota bacterium]
MTKKFFLLLFLIAYTFLCNAQEKEKHYIVHRELDTVCSHFIDLLSINFDVNPNRGCEFLITQLFNKSTQFLDDSLSYQWTVFNDDYSIHFMFDEENPDIFLHEPGNYHIELIITNMYSCTDTLTKYNVITIDKMPQINFTVAPENALFAEYFGEVEFTNLTDPVLLGDPTVEWYWDMGDNIMNTTVLSPVHLFSTWGDYHTTFHLKTKNGCNVALTKTVTIEDELFFPDTLKNNSQTFPSIFAVTNLNTHIPKDDPDEFRTNHLFIYDKNGKQVYEQQNYDTYVRNNIVIKGARAFCAADFTAGAYYYSFYYKGKNKMVHYSGEVWIRE